MSDGVLQPAQVAQRAADNGVQLWSLTDHDEVRGLAQAQEASQQLGLQFISGVEISAAWAGQSVHIVGLNIDPNEARLNAGLARIRECRVDRAIIMGRRLESLGWPGAYEGALRYAGNPALVSRTHFARFLVEQGACENLQEVFNKYLADGKPGYVRGQWATVQQAVEWIHRAGGVAVIAHPGRYNYTDTQEHALFDEFRQLGGEAIEVITGSHRPEDYAKYTQLAQHYGFMASRGSDFHAPSESKIDMGALPPLPEGLVPVWRDWV